MTLIRSLTLVAVLGLAGTVCAQEGAATPGPRGPCAQDAQRLCADQMGAGREAVRHCMRQNQSQLSDACRARLAEARQKRGVGAGQSAPGTPQAP